jgi:hypothetical protein
LFCWGRFQVLSAATGAIAAIVLKVLEIVVLKVVFQIIKPPAPLGGITPIITGQGPIARIRAAG